MGNHKWNTIHCIWNRSVSQYDMIPSPCIALYVQIKGFLPIEPIHDRYPVDVREGVFRLCGSPTDLHHHVRMGCALDSEFGTQQGTIGPLFIFKNEPCTYLLTSAHVFT